MRHLYAAWKGKSAPGTYVAVLLLGIVGWFILGSIPMVVAAFSKGILSDDAAGLQQMFSENGYLLLVFSSFVIGLLIFALLVPLMHKRGFCSVINGGRPLRWGHFLTAFALYFLVMAILQGWSLLYDSDNYVWQFDSAAFVRVLPVLLLCVPLQTLFEEYLFRGYLMQAMAVWSGRVWIAWLLPALLFSLAHSFNPEVGAYGFALMMVQYLAFGLLFGWFTLADDGLEVSWGMHTANNLFLLLFVTEEHSALPTPALWLQLDATPSLKETVRMLFFMMLLWEALRRIYRWKTPSLRKIANPGGAEIPTKENNDGI